MLWSYIESKDDYPIEEFNQELYSIKRPEQGVSESTIKSLYKQIGINYPRYENFRCSEQCDAYREGLKLEHFFESISVSIDNPSELKACFNNYDNIYCWIDNLFIIMKNMDNFEITDLNRKEYIQLLNDTQKEVFCYS